MLTASPPIPHENDKRYGMGFWFDPANQHIRLIGCDAGVSFASTVSRDTNNTHTVISNTSKGAWPIARLFNDKLANQ